MDLREGIIMQVSRDITTFLCTMPTMKQLEEYGYRADLYGQDYPDVQVFKDLFSHRELNRLRNGDLSLFCTRMYKRYPLAEFPETSGLICIILNIQEARETGTKTDDSSPPKAVSS